MLRGRVRRASSINEGGVAAGLEAARLSITQEAGTGIGADSYGSYCTLLLVRLPFATDVQLRAGSEGSVRATTDDVY